MRRTRSLKPGRLLGVVALAALGGSGAVRAQSTAPPTTQAVEADGRRPRRGILSIDDLSIGLGFDAGGTRDHVRTEPMNILQPRAYPQRDETLFFRETIDLESSGSIINERILRYEMMTRWGLSQERFQESRPWPDPNLDTNPHGQVLEYDLRLQALPVGKVSANASASQLRDRVPRPFLPSLDRRREQYNAVVTLNDPVLPMSLTFDHLFDELKGGNTFEYGNLDDKQENGQDTFSYDATWQPTENHSLKLNETYQDLSEQYSGINGNFDTTRNEVSLLDTIQFGSQRQHRLESLFRDQEESGAWAQDITEASERLLLQHSETLSTTYGVQWLREAFQQLESKMLRGDAGVSHTYADMLTSTLNLYGLRQDTNENSDLTEWGSLANWAFSRQNSMGRFSSNVSYNHTDSQTHDGERDALVLSESATFRDPLPVYLAHAQINPWTIVVRDAQRLLFYLPGRDYIVLPLGKLTALVRVPTGYIQNGQTVLVSYAYETLDNYKLRRDRGDWRIQQDFNGGFSPYYAGTLQQEDLSPKTNLLWEDRNINRQRVGATYRRPRWSVGSEYEYNDDSVDPYQAVHGNGDVVLLQNASHQLNARSTVSRFDFRGQRTGAPPDGFIIDLYPRRLPHRDVTLLDMGLDYRFVMGPKVETGVTAAYRYQDDSIYGLTNGVDLRGNVAYRIGQFTVLFEIEYETLSLPSSDQDSFGFWIKVRREIPVISGARS